VEPLRGRPDLLHHDVFNRTTHDNRREMEH
jgi:hypothetical protein